MQQRDFKRAGIDIKNSNSRKIIKNYRNTKQILEVAYYVLLENLVDEIIRDMCYNFGHPLFYGACVLFSTSQILIDLCVKESQDQRSQFETQLFLSSKSQRMIAALSQSLVELNFKFALLYIFDLQ